MSQRRTALSVIITQRSLRISIRRTRSSASTMTAWLTTRCDEPRPAAGRPSTATAFPNPAESTGTRTGTRINRPSVATTRSTF